MKHEDEFYIGWQDKAPALYKSSRKVFFMVSLLIMIIFGVMYLFIERQFIESTFDFGNLTELEGRVVEYPVFGLSTMIDGRQVTVPLVGFGKFDALPVLEKIKSSAGNDPLENFRVKLRGTLIKYKDRIWMELTEGDESIVEISRDNTAFQRIVMDKGEQTIFGEIVDPKCFFGVMNPAYGKIHKSCAIRCISGGIPPILAVRENGDFTDYYFLVDENGGPINGKVLPFVGMPVSTSGTVQQLADWNVISIDPHQISAAIQVRLDRRFAYCF